jgi:hypothetical protein
MAKRENFIVKCQSNCQPIARLCTIAKIDEEAVQNMLKSLKQVRINNSFTLV